jgi:hypothetical protein
MSDSHSAGNKTRREMIKKARYVAPVVLTLAASPAFAQRGSGYQPPPPPPRQPRP